MKIGQALLALCVVAGPTFAGEITALGDWQVPCSYKFTGLVEPGDADRIAQLDTFSPVGASLCLDSPGGSLPEGIRMFNMIWDKQIHTRVMNGDVCESACAIAWLGGSLTLGTAPARVPSRSIEPDALLGFHSPRLDLPEGGTYPAEQVEAAFRVALKSAEGLFDIKLTTQDSAGALNDFLYARILETPGDRMFHITTLAEALMSNVLISAVRAPEKISAANLVHLCENAWLVQRGVDVTLDDAVRHLTMLRRGAVSGERVKYVNAETWVIRMDVEQRSQYLCVISDSDVGFYLQQAGEFNTEPAYLNGGGESPTIRVSLQEVDSRQGVEQVWKEIEDGLGQALAAIDMPHYALMDGMTPLADLPRH